MKNTADLKFTFKPNTHLPTQSAQFKLFLLIWKGKKGRRLRLDRELKAQKFKKHREQKRQHVIKKK